MQRTWDTQNLEFNEVWADRAQRGFFLKRWDHPSWAKRADPDPLKVRDLKTNHCRCPQLEPTLKFLNFAPRERMGVLVWAQIGRKHLEWRGCNRQNPAGDGSESDPKWCHFLYIVLKQNEKRGKQDSVAWFLQTFQTHLYHLSGAELRSGENLPVEDPVAAPKPRVAAGACSQNGKSWDSDCKFLKRKWKKMRKNDDKNEVKVTAKPRLLPPLKGVPLGNPNLTPVALGPSSAKSRVGVGGFSR